MTGRREVVVGLGSNIEAAANIRRALGRLSRLGEILRRSELLATAPFGPPGQPPFVNTAILLCTCQGRGELGRSLRALEAALGRVRSADRYAPRPIDLDLLVDGSEILDPEVALRPYLRGALHELRPALTPPPPAGRDRQGSDDRLLCRPRRPAEELERVAATIRSPPWRAFLHRAEPSGEPFDWPDYVELVLRAAALLDHLGGRRYSPSLELLRRRHARDPDHLVHLALACRQYGHELRPSRRRVFHRRARRLVAGLP